MEIVSLGDYYTPIDSIKNGDKINLRLDMEILKISLTHINETIGEHIMMQEYSDHKESIENCIRGLVIRFENQFLSKE